MDGITLLAEARAAGLTVMVEGARLRIRGPKRAEPIARRLIAHKEDVLTALTEDAGPLDPRPVAGSSLRGWDTEARELIAFFQSARPRLPRMPFRLTRWQYISDPDKWYRSLELDISSGPLGCRARMRVLQEDLRRLREYLSSRDDT